MKKGCLIGLGSAAVVMTLVIGGCIYAAKQYEKEHPESTAASYALMDVQAGLLAPKGEVAQGNDARARAMAKQFAVAMKLARSAFFTEPDSDQKTLSDGQFITYCSLHSDRCAFIVHVPQLRNYSPDAKVEMAEMAWRMAVNVLRNEKIEVKELAVGIRGLMDYGPILVGRFTPDGDAMSGIKIRTDNSGQEILYPFFVGNTNPDH